MNSEISPATPFAALPVRRRETLDIFDTALKLYRRYFWVLIGWSALVSVTAFTSIFSGPLYLLTMPFLYGSTACCIAGAVRGQNVGFRQCWQFSKPRYGAMLGTLLLSGLVFFAVIIALYLAMALIGVLGVLVLSNAPEPVRIVAIVLGVIALVLFFSVMSVFAFGWLNMVPIIACLEDDKRGPAAMGRAFDLLKGHWLRVCGMSLVLGLAVLAVSGIILGVFGFLNIGAFQEMFGSNFSENAFMRLMMTFSGFMSLFYVLWLPAQNLVVAVLYLDLRVRREALDLEWTAYSSAPPPAPTDAMALETAPRAVEMGAEPSLMAPATFSASPSGFAAVSDNASTDMNGSLSDVNGATSDINSITSDVNSATSDRNAIPTDFNGATTDINSVTSDNNDMPADIRSVTTDIDSVATDVNGVATNIDNAPTAPSEVSSSFAPPIRFATGAVERVEPMPGVETEVFKAERD